MANVFYTPYPTVAAEGVPARSTDRMDINAPPAAFGVLKAQALEKGGAELEQAGQRAFEVAKSYTQMQNVTMASAASRPARLLARTAPRRAGRHDHPLRDGRQHRVLRHRGPLAPEALAKTGTRHLRRLPKRPIPHCGMVSVTDPEKSWRAGPGRPRRAL
jgi:hypothetical protein